MTPEELKEITDRLYTPKLRHSLKYHGGWHPLVEMKRKPTNLEEWYIRLGMENYPPYLPSILRKEIFHLWMIGHSEFFDDLICFVELDVTWKEANLLLILGQLPQGLMQ